MFPGHVLFKCSAGSLLDLGKHMLMVVACQDLTERNRGVRSKVCLPLRIWRANW